MARGGASFIPGGYLSGKVSAAEEKKDRLLNALNRLTQISYEKGTRDGDAGLREKVRGMVATAEQWYRMVRTFLTGKGADTGNFGDILDFFEGQFMERNSLRELADDLKNEIERQEELDRQHNLRHADDGYLRRANAYVTDLKKDLSDWQRVFSYHVEPLVRGFLHDVNDIVLFHRLEARLGRMMTNEDVFMRSGALYAEFKESIARFARLNILLTGSYSSEKDVADGVNRALQQMGFRNLILRARNVNSDVLGSIIMEIINENGLGPLARSRGTAARGAVEAIKTVEKKDPDGTVDPSLLKKILEDLCYIEEMDGIAAPDPSMQTAGLAEKSDTRYLFHVPGTFDISLRFVSEYLRNSLILVIDWLVKETQKSPAVSGPLRPLLDAAPSVREFITAYRLALDIASVKTNQAQSSLGARERHYIPRALARQLIRSIADNCTRIRRGLVDAAYNVAGERQGVLAKKVGVIQEACNDAHAKIARGLSDIEKA